MSKLLVAPDGSRGMVDDSEVAEALENGYQLAESGGSGFPSPGAVAGSMGRGLRDVAAEHGANALPWLTAAGMGALAGPAFIPAVGAAALGGGGGEAGRQLINRARGRGGPETAGEALTDIGREGAVQGAAAAVGQGLVRTAGAAARPLMNSAVRAGKMLKREFGDIAGHALKYRVPVGKNVMLPFLQKGSTKAGEMRGASGAELERVLTEMEARGHKLTVTDLLNYVNRRIKSMAKNPVTAEESAALSGLRKELVERVNPRGPKGRMTKPTKLAPRAVHEVKTAAQKRATRYYRAEAGGANPEVVGPKQTFNRDLARGSRAALENLDPRYGPINRRTQELIGLERAVSNAELRDPPPMSLMHPGSLPIGSAIFSPEVISRLALMLTNPAARYGLPLGSHAATSLFQTEDR